MNHLAITGWGIACSSYTVTISWEICMLFKLLSQHIVPLNFQYGIQIQLTKLGITHEIRTQKQHSFFSNRLGVFFIVALYNAPPTSAKCNLLFDSPTIFSRQLEVNVYKYLTFFKFTWRPDVTLLMPYIYRIFVNFIKDTCITTIFTNISHGACGSFLYLGSSLSLYLKTIRLIFLGFAKM